MEEIEGSSCSFTSSQDTTERSTRTKREALLQRCKMALNSASKELSKGWLQQSQILAAKAAHRSRVAAVNSVFAALPNFTIGAAKSLQMVFKNSGNVWGAFAAIRGPTVVQKSTENFSLFSRGEMSRAIKQVMRNYL